MILGFFTLLIAMAISAVAAYYSILGLIAIFAAAALPVIVMGGVLEAGKLMAAVWLHKNWHRASALYKMYLVPAVAFLMLLTSMGVFGFLSKAHLDQGLPTADIAAQVALIDERIKAQQENIDVTKKVITQLDTAVDQVLERSTSERGARRAAELRKEQAKERSQLQDDIDAAQKEIAKLREEKAQVTVELRQLEAEVGPLKYVAELIYGENPNENLLDKAVRWVIILIVVVFDPLAVVLLLAATRQFEWAKSDREKKRLADKSEKIDTRIANQAAKISELETKLREQTRLEALVNEKQEQIERLTEQYEKKFNEAEDLRAELGNSQKDPNLIAELDEKVRRLQSQEIELIEARKMLVSMQNDQEKLQKLYEKALERNHSSLTTVTENTEESAREIRVEFGSVFSRHPSKGDLFIRTDFNPSKLFKWNGDQWLNIGKNTTDAYLIDSYVDYLEQQYKSGNYQWSQLSAGEKEALEQRGIS